jgi:hypothetical protein
MDKDIEYRALPLRLLAKHARCFSRDVCKARTGTKDKDKNGIISLLILPGFFSQIALQHRKGMFVSLLN